MMSKTYVFNCRDSPGYFHEMQVCVTAEEFDNAKQRAILEAGEVCEELLHENDYNNVEAVLETVEVTI